MMPLARKHSSPCPPTATRPHHWSSTSLSNGSRGCTNQEEIFFDGRNVKTMPITLSNVRRQDDGLKEVAPTKRVFPSVAEVMVVSDQLPSFNSLAESIVPERERPHHASSPSPPRPSICFKTL